MKTLKILNLFWENPLNVFDDINLFDEKNLNRFIGITTIVITGVIVYYYINGGTPPSVPEIIQEPTIVIKSVKKLTEEVNETEKITYLSALEFITSLK